MIAIDDLKKILLLDDFTDAMLEELRPLVQFREYKEREIVFNENDPAESLFMLKRGKVVMEVEVSPRLVMTLGAVKYGFCFGWSSLSGAERIHKSNAICTEPSEVMWVPGEEFLELLERHPEQGYRVMKNIFSIFKRRMERRTVQLINVIRNHPDMKDFYQEGPSLVNTSTAMSP